MTQTSITTLERALQVAGLIESSSLVIVDNSSLEPLTLDHISAQVALQIIRLDKNHSFSAASNLGAKKLMDKECLLFLNNDVFLHPRALETMLADRASFSASICGARLVYPNGKIQHAGVAFGIGSEPHHLHHYEYSRLIPRITSQLQAVTGAVMLIDSSLFWELQGFDENFPFAYEDTDFCLRAAATGAKTICSQSVDSIHLSGQTRDDKTKSFEKFSRNLFLERWGGRVSPDLQ
jgi:GT2 family glycosyltransferase